MRLIERHKGDGQDVGVQFVQQRSNAEGWRVRLESERGLTTWFALLSALLCSATPQRGGLGGLVIPDNWAHAIDKSTIAIESLPVVRIPRVAQEGLQMA